VEATSPDAFQLVKIRPVDDRQDIAGFPFDSLRNFEANSGVEAAVVVSILGIPERTLARRRTAGRLAPEESERLLRVSTVFEKAVGLFDGDIASAATSPNTSLLPSAARNMRTPGST
jgi:putative toxin-antitoxin system antitoxin component (TIGR02293 family)